MQTGYKEGKTLQWSPFSFHFFSHIRQLEHLIDPPSLAHHPCLPPILDKYVQLNTYIMRSSILLGTFLAMAIAVIATPIPEPDAKP